MHHNMWQKWRIFPAQSDPFECSPHPRYSTSNFLTTNGIQNQTHQQTSVSNGSGCGSKPWYPYFHIRMLAKLMFFPNEIIYLKVFDNPRMNFHFPSLAVTWSSSNSAFCRSHERLLVRHGMVTTVLRQTKTCLPNNGG